MVSILIHISINIDPLRHEELRMHGKGFQTISIRVCQVTQPISIYTNLNEKLLRPSKGFKFEGISSQIDLKIKLYVFLYICMFVCMYIDSMLTSFTYLIMTK